MAIPSTMDTGMLTKLIINKPVVIDNNIITSYCPQTAPTVAFKLMALLIGEENVNVIKHGMGY